MVCPLTFYYIHVYAAITCSSPMELIHGSVFYDGATVPVDRSANFTFGVLAIYSCDTEFVLVGSKRRTCTGDGNSTIGAFDGEAPVCTGEWRLDLHSYFLQSIH